MKTIVSLVLMCIMIVGLAGCGGVWCDAKYSALLDQTTALSTETAVRAVEGKISCDEMKLALLKQSETWKQFQAAKDGKEVSK